LSLPSTTRSAQTRIDVLLSAVGIAPESFHRFLEWTLSEHLVMALSNVSDIDDDFFQRQDALRAFRDVLTRRTGRTWSQGDLVALFDRVKLEKTQHFRKPIQYEEYLKLLWQVPLAWIPTDAFEANKMTPGLRVFARETEFQCSQKGAPIACPSVSVRSLVATPAPSHIIPASLGRVLTATRSRPHHGTNGSNARSSYRPPRPAIQRWRVVRPIPVRGNPG